MARRKLNEEDIMAVTEALLLEKGYEGFHFRLLADKLNVGRSTIYEYYMSKEELVTSYMIKVMDKFFHDCEQLSKLESPIAQLKGLLQLFIKYSQIHQIIEMMPLIDPEVSPAVRKALDRLWDDHNLVFEFIHHIVEAGKQIGEIRTDIPTSVVTALFFNANRMSHEPVGNEREWGEFIFRILHEGMGTKTDTDTSVGN